MTEEPQPKFSTRKTVEKQLKEQRKEHRQHLVRALMKSHPDIVTVDAQDKLIQRIDRALAHLKALTKEEIKAALEG